MAVGFGRTGSMFACEQAAVSPDFLCLSKGLRGGYLALASVLSTDEVYRAFYGDFASRVAFLHAHASGRMPISCSSTARAVSGGPPSRCWSGGAGACASASIGPPIANHRWI
jgi:adenosylmethionine---8-amino-7-oxononanoate aminotransferase